MNPYFKFFSATNLAKSEEEFENKLREFVVYTGIINEAKRRIVKNRNNL